MNNIRLPWDVFHALPLRVSVSPTVDVHESRGHVRESSEYVLEDFRPNTMVKRTRLGLAYRQYGMVVGEWKSELLRMIDMYVSARDTKVEVGWHIDDRMYDRVTVQWPPLDLDAFVTNTLGTFRFLDTGADHFISINGHRSSGFTLLISPPAKEVRTIRWPILTRSKFDELKESQEFSSFLAQYDGYLADQIQEAEFSRMEQYLCSPIRRNRAFGRFLVQHLKADQTVPWITLDLNETGTTTLFPWKHNITDWSDLGTPTVRWLNAKLTYRPTVFFGTLCNSPQFFSSSSKNDIKRPVKVHLREMQLPSTFWEFTSLETWDVDDTVQPSTITVAGFIAEREPIGIPERNVTYPVVRPLGLFADPQLRDFSPMAVEYGIRFPDSYRVEPKKVGVCILEHGPIIQPSKAITSSLSVEIMRYCVFAVLAAERCEQMRLPPLVYQLYQAFRRDVPMLPDGMFEGMLRGEYYSKYLNENTCGTLRDAIDALPIVYLSLFECIQIDENIQVSRYWRATGQQAISKYVSWLIIRLPENRYTSAIPCIHDGLFQRPFFNKDVQRPIFQDADVNPLTVRWPKWQPAISEDWQALLQTEFRQLPRWWCRRCAPLHWFEPYRADNLYTSELFITVFTTVGNAYPETIEAVRWILRDRQAVRMVGVARRHDYSTSPKSQECTATQISFQNTVGYPMRIYTTRLYINDDNYPPGDGEEIEDEGVVYRITFNPTCTRYSL